MVTLNEVLDKLATRHQAYFSYDLETVQAIRSKPYHPSGKPLEKELSDRLRGTGLDFKKMGDHNYVIFKIQKNGDRKNPAQQPINSPELPRLTTLAPILPPANPASSPAATAPQPARFIVRGTVRDEDGAELIGATVQSRKVPGIGTVTSLDGSYELELPDAQDTLVFTYTGYKTLEAPVQGRPEIDVVLAQALQTLDEVVVVGYGTQKKRYTTGAVAKVKGEDLQNGAQSTVESTLQGRVAGVMVTTSDAMAGSPVTIRIRGTSSIVASSEPLYVVDGVPVVSGNYSKNNASGWRLATAHESNALAQLNPADIESVEILKDASTAAIYGSRGANGVVLITNKRGKEGKTRFDAGFQTGFSKETRRIRMLDGPSYLELAREAWTNSYLDALADADPGNDLDYDIADDYEKFWKTILPPGLSRETAERTDTDWIDEALQTGHFQETNLSAAGGNEKTLFYLGGTYRDERGIFVGNDFKRYNARVNLDHHPTDFLSIGARTAFTVTDNDIIPTSWAGGLGSAQSQALPFWPVYNEDGTYFHPQSGYNVAAELANTDMNQKGTSILGNVYAQLSFLRHFTLRSEFGVNNIYKKEFYYRSAVIEPAAIATSVLSESRNWNSNNTLSYSLSKGRQNLEILVGSHATRNDYFSNVINGETFPNPSMKNPENAASKTAEINATQFSFLSFLGRLNYRFHDRYLLSLSLRRDASSRFGPGNRWGTFPAASLGWILSEENFLRSQETLSFLKLRLSWGMTGNAEIGNFEYFGAFATNNYVEMPGMVVQEINNPGLGWEATSQFDAGIDFGFLDGRIEGGWDVYVKKTTDLLAEIDVSSLAGVERVTSNIGSLLNKGMDCSLTGHPRIGRLKWAVTLNIAFNQNEITDLGGRDFIPGEGFGLGAVGVGFPVGARFVVRSGGIAAQDMTLTVTNPAGGTSEIQVPGGDELFINRFGELTNVYDPLDQVFYGNPNPRWTGGLTNAFSYGPFDLSFLVTFATGQDLANEEQRFQYGGIGYGWNMWADGLDRWRQPGDNTHVPRLTWTAPNRNWVSSRGIFNADFARLKDVSISYNLPAKQLRKWKVSQARLYARGTNLAVLSTYPGWGPGIQPRRSRQCRPRQVLAAFPPGQDHICRPQPLFLRNDPVSFTIETPDDAKAISPLVLAPAAGRHLRLRRFPRPETGNQPVQRRSL